MSVAMFRRRVDARKLAGRAARLEGDLPPDSLGRLSGLLARGDHDDHIRASLDFWTDARGIVLLSGDVEASLTMPCQRCLEPVQVPVTSAFRFALQAGASGSEAAPEGCEVLEETGDGIVPADLIEEELLLALPFAAAHESLSECGELAQHVADTAAADEAEHPFAVLKDLKLD